MTIVLVTNLVQQAHRLADHTAFLNSSQLVEVGATDADVHRAPSEPADVRLRARAFRMTRRRAASSVTASRREDLNLWYGDFQALKNVQRRHPQGLITALIGPSGCGKTTLLRCFNRINERYGNVTTTGEITILGKNIYDADVSLGELRKTVGMVFQRPNPLPISIYENVVFGLRVHSRRARAQTRSARRAGRGGAHGGAALERRQGQAAPEGHAPDARAAAEAVHRAAAAAQAARDPDGRALLGARRRGHRGHRAPDGRARGKYTIVIVTHNMAQARRDQRRVHLHAAGRAHRARPDASRSFSGRSEKKPRCTSKAATVKRART